MPWLDLLPEEDLHFGRVFLLEDGEDAVIDGVKEFGREGAHVVEI